MNKETPSPEVTRAVASAQVVVTTSLPISSKPPASPMPSTVTTSSEQVEVCTAQSKPQTQLTIAITNPVNSTVSVCPNSPPASPNNHTQSATNTVVTSESATNIVTHPIVTNPSSLTSNVTNLTTLVTNLTSNITKPTPTVSKIPTNFSNITSTVTLSPFTNVANLATSSTNTSNLTTNVPNLPTNIINVTTATLTLSTTVQQQFTVHGPFTTLHSHTGPAPNVTVNPNYHPEPPSSPVLRQIPTPLATDQQIRVLTPSEIMRTLPSLCQDSYDIPVSQSTVSSASLNVRTLVSMFFFVDIDFVFFGNFY